jgi:hypothetical protein
MSAGDHIRSGESAAFGEVVAANAKAIFDAHGAATMAGLQSRLYKDTEVGVSVSFRLHEGPDVYVGDPRAAEIAGPWNWIRSIGVSSIVEGSDAEVPLEWIDLASPPYADEGGEARAVAEFAGLVERVNDAACGLWDEASGADDAPAP